MAEGMQSLEDFELESMQKPSKTKKIQKQTSARPRLYSNWLLMENDLQNIIEEDENNSENNESKSEIQSSEQMENQDDQECSDDQEDMDDESSKLHNYESKYSNTNLPINKNQVSAFEWETQNPKNQIIGHLKAICNNPQIDSDEQKIEMLKLKLKYYLFEHQYYFFEEAFKQCSGALKDIINTLIKGIEQTFKKTVAGLIFQKRRLKMLKYMEKKKGRVWRKKVNYNCRKQVADKRLRIKGKFVTLDQALEQLGLPSIEGYTPNELKQMLQKKVQQQ